MTVITSVTIFKEVTIVHVMRDSGYVVIVEHVMVSDSVCIDNIVFFNKYVV